MSNNKLSQPELRRSTSGTLSPSTIEFLETHGIDPNEHIKKQNELRRQNSSSPFNPFFLRKSESSSSLSSENLSPRPPVLYRSSSSHAKSTTAFLQAAKENNVAEMAKLENIESKNPIDIRSHEITIQGGYKKTILDIAIDNFVESIRSEKDSNKHANITNKTIDVINYLCTPITDKNGTTIIKGLSAAGTLEYMAARTNTESNLLTSKEYQRIEGHLNNISSNQQYELGERFPGPGYASTLSPRPLSQRAEEAKQKRNNNNPDFYF